MTIRKQYLRLACAASLLLFSTLVSSSAAQADVTYSGRAYAAYVNLPGIIPPQYISDTGELPPSGGFISRPFLTIDLDALHADVLVATTSGAAGVARSSASLANVTVLPASEGRPLLTASLVQAESEVTCNGMRGTTDVAEVTFGDLNVEVTGEPNQTITIPGVATLVINEQMASTGGGLQAMTVNALHLTLHTPLGGEVILAHAHSDIAGCPGCPPPPSCDDFVTGGGWIRAGNSRANFGFNAGNKGSSPPEVHLNYIDHGTGMHVKATSITIYEQGDTSLTRHFEGLAEVNGTPNVPYSVDVADNGEPGRKTDTFKISLGSGEYSAGGTLEGGNIQLHKPCP